MKVQSTNSYARLDGLFAFLMALGCVVYGNLIRVPWSEMHRFLEMRVTVLNAAFAGIFMLAWIFCFRALNLYGSGSDSVLHKLIQIAKGCGLMTGLLVFYLRATHTTGPTGRIGLLFFVSAMCYQACRVLFGLWIAGRDPQLVVILGSGRRAGKAWREIRTQYHSTVKLVGFVDDRPVSEMAPDIADRYLGRIDDLSELLLRNVVDELLIAVPMKSCYAHAQRAIEIAEEVGVPVAYMHDVYATKLRRSVHRDQELFGELVPFHEHYVTRQAVKRLVDLVGSALGLLLLSPVFLAIAIAIKATSKGPVLFVQERYGHRRRLFPMFKFRSMVKNAPELMKELESQNEAGGPIFKIARDPRITPLGRFLRASSLDELPQLLNVLLGHMSLVGPRPMSVRDVSLFDDAILMRRFTVKPGITGLWQVSGRSSLTFEQWMKLDFHYIDDWSLAMDFQILARTVAVVLKGTGAV